MASPSRYERTLGNYARSLSDFIALQLDEPSDDFWSNNFPSWVKANRRGATKHAEAYVRKYLIDKADNKTVDHTLRIHIAAWKTYGVEVTQEIKDEITALTRDKLRPDKLTRLNALGSRKSDQFDLLEQNWDTLIEYLGSTSGEQFAEDCRTAQPSQKTSIACEMAYLSRKPVVELEQALLRTRAFVSLLRCTGMRSITAVTLRLDQFTEAGDGGALLLKRMERKCGSTRNVEKPIFVCVVPHADPKLCPIVHIAEALGQVDPAYELFAEGFTHKPGQDYVSFATMVQRRYIAILQCACFAIGVSALFADKKLHAFRVQCTNVMCTKGATESEREAHIGWQSSVQSRHYASLKHTALNARTGHLLAGRSGRDDPPHPMWQCLTQAPGEGYWQRVLHLATAAGYVPGPSDPQFLKLVAERIAAGNPEREDSPAYLLKRVKQLEQENTDLRKRTRPQEAVEQLTNIVAGLKTRACDADFPQQCFAALEQLSALIEEASERGNLGIPQSTADGKALTKILVLGAVVRKHGELAFAQHANEGRSWFAWLSDNGKDDPRVASVSTKTWKAFKESGLD
jgi:hypothetical protein